MYVYTQKELECAQTLFGLKGMLSIEARMATTPRDNFAHLLAATEAEVPLRRAHPCRYQLRAVLLAPNRLQLVHYKDHRVYESGCTALR